MKGQIYNVMYNQHHNPKKNMFLDFLFIMELVNIFTTLK